MVSTAETLTRQTFYLSVSLSFLFLSVQSGQTAASRRRLYYRLSIKLIIYAGFEFSDLHLRTEWYTHTRWTNMRHGSRLLSDENRRDNGANTSVVHRCFHRGSRSRGVYKKQIDKIITVES